MPTHRDDDTYYLGAVRVHVMTVIRVEHFTAVVGKAYLGDRLFEVARGVVAFVATGVPYTSSSEAKISLRRVRNRTIAECISICGRCLRDNGRHEVEDFPRIDNTAHSCRNLPGIEVRATVFGERALESAIKPVSINRVNNPNGNSSKTRPQRDLFKRGSPKRSRECGVQRVRYPNQKLR